MTDFGHDDSRLRLERELRAAAPQARALFVDEVARRVHAQRFAIRPTRLRMGLALAFSSLTIVALGALGAPGYVAHAATAIVSTATTTLTGGGSPGPSGSGTVGSTSGTDQYAVAHGICHRTGNTTTPWALIFVVSADELDGHAEHGDIIPAPPWGCPPAAPKGTRPSATTTVIGGPTALKITQQATFLITVSSGNGSTPTGTVSCFDNFKRFVGSVALVNGAASCKLTFTYLGVHQMTAVYKTDDVNKWASSAGNVLNTNVTKGTSIVSIDSNLTPAPFGAGVTFTAEVPTSMSTTAAPNTAGTISVAPSGGASPATTVAWTPSTFGTAPAVVSASVEPPPHKPGGVQFAAGTAVIRIDAVTEAGQPITALNDALDIAIPDAPADIAPMYQRGNDPWVLIPRLPGTTLPTAQPDGWYMAGSTLHILTRHLTRFGLAKALSVGWGTRRRVHLNWAHRIVVFAAPSVDATATYTLRRGTKVYGTWTRTLPAGKGAPANLWLAGKNVVPGRYHLTIDVKAGPQRWTQVVAIRYLR
jgi:hypothetical protein